MSNDLLKYRLVVFALCGFLASCANAQSGSIQDPAKSGSPATHADLSTNEGVLAELQKIVDARNEKIDDDDEKLAAKRRAASKLDADSVCIERLKESAKVIVVAFFRNDYGCHFEGAFVDSLYYEAGSLEIHKAALDALGWRKANQKQRENLARVWVEKGLLAFFTVLYADEKNRLQSRGFHPPETVSEENGDVKVRLWIQMPSGRAREKGFQHEEYRFKPDGNFSGSSTLAAVLVP